MSKIERGTTRDLQDVERLIKQSVITLQELDVAFAEVPVQMGKGRYSKLDPNVFATQYQVIRSQL